MTVNSAEYLTQLHNLLNQHFNLEDIYTLCFQLNIDYESVEGKNKPSYIRELLLALGRNDRLEELLIIVQQQRPKVEWPAVPEDFQLPESLVSNETTVPLNQYHIFGDSVQGDKIMGDKVINDVTLSGDVVGKDKIVTTIDVVVNNAYTAAQEARARQELEQELLAEAVARYSKDLRQIISSSDMSTTPYKELRSFRLQDASLFFGRGQAIRQMLKRLASSRFVLLHSESGAGKTSLIRAGLIPRLLAQGQLPVYVRVWQQNPTISIKHQLLPNLNQTSNLLSTSLRDFLHQVLNILGKDTSLVIFLDQFETFFTQKLMQSVGKSFIAELGECLDDSSLSVQFVVSIRDEYFGQISFFQPRVSSPFSHEYLLQSLTKKEAKAAIVEPIRLLGGDIETSLADNILDDFQTETIMPTQLQLVCWALYKQGQENNSEPSIHLTNEAYTSLGGLDAVMRDYLDRVLKQNLLAEQRQAAKQILATLVTATGERDQKSLADLKRILHHFEDTAVWLDSILATLVDNHVLHTVQTGELDEKIVYELVHDYLLDEILPWVDGDQQHAKYIYNMLIQGHLDYETYGRLFDQDQLDIVQRQLSNAYLSLTAMDVKFLLTSALNASADEKAWLKMANEHATTWLREIGTNKNQPESLRLATITRLGQMGDDDTFSKLHAQVAAGEEPTFTPRALALFIDNTQQKLSYGKKLSWSVNRKLAKTQFHLEKEHIHSFRQILALTAAVCTLLGTTDLAAELFGKSLELTYFILYGFPIISFLLALGWGTLFARLWVLLIRKSWAWQTAAFIFSGGVMGLFLFIFMIAEVYGWAAGVVLGGYLAWLSRTRSYERHRYSLLTVTGALLTMAVCFLILMRRDWTKDAPSLITGLVLTTIFSIQFIYQAMKLFSKSNFKS